MKILMKMVIIGFMLGGCGKATTLTGNLTTATATPTATPSAAAVDSPNPVLQSGDTTIAYVLSFQGEDDVTVYMPGLSRYAYIALSTGNYVQTQTYFSGAGCTGTAMAGSWVGEIGKSVIYANSTYYLITGFSTASFAYQSYWNTVTQACVNASSSTTAGIELGTVKVTTQPYSFTGGAPWTPIFN